MNTIKHFMAFGILSAWLVGCAGDFHHAQPSASPESTEALPAVTETVLEAGLYEIVSTYRGPIYVSAAGKERDDAGKLLEIDPVRLQQTQSIATPKQAFGLAINRKTGIVYIGHTVDNMISAFDTHTGQIQGSVQLVREDERGGLVRPRQIVVAEDTNTVYVGGVSPSGIVWAIDGKTLAIRDVIHVRNSIGLAYDAEKKRVYTGGNGAWNVIDASKGKWIDRFHIKDKSERFLINLAVDSKGKRLFAADYKYGDLLVFSTETGQLLKVVPSGKNTLDVAYNPLRNEIYTSNRSSGTVSIFDGNDYTLKKEVPLGGIPNSLDISPDGNLLFVSLKMPAQGSRGYREDEKESIARIVLR